MKNNNNHWRTAENHIELYEAIYFFNRIYDGKHVPSQPLIYNAAIEATGIHESVFNAVLKILVVNELLKFKNHAYYSSPETLAALQKIHEQVIKGDRNKQANDLFERATDKNQFFFNGLSHLEYDIYSRYDFEVTFKLGREVGKYIGLENARVLELGGNSGGLAAAFIAENKQCHFTVVDLPIPCKVGRELNLSLNQSLKFIEADVFHLDLPNDVYDHILAVNFLHDFDDDQCQQVLKNCEPYTNNGTKFTVIEDLLESNFEPKLRIMHGLRLAAECRGGRQRTVSEMAAQFKLAGYTQVSISIINNMHTCMTFEKK